MSSDGQTGDGTGNLPDDVPAKWYETLRHPRRIRLLDALHDEGAPIALPELTAAVADREPDGTTARDVRVSLVHNHLPRLVSLDFVRWDGERVTDHREISVPTGELSALLEDCGPQRRLLETLVHPVRTRIYTILRNRPYEHSIDELAAELVEREAGPLSDPETARVALYHVHLPAMDDVGAIEFDRRAGLVRRADHLTATTK